MAAIVISAALLGDALSGDEEVTGVTDSGRADELVLERFANERGGRGREATEVIVVRSSSTTVDEARFERRVQGIAAQLQRVGMTRVTARAAQV